MLTILLFIVVSWELIGDSPVETLNDVMADVKEKLPALVGQ